MIISRNVGEGLAPPASADFDRISKRAVGAGFYPARAVQCHKSDHTYANTNAPVGVDDPVRPAERTTAFMKPTGKLAIAQRADRGVRPYRNFFRFRRWRVQFCNCIPPGRCGHRPLQTLYGFVLVRSDLQVRTAGRTGSSAPTGARRFALARSNLRCFTARAGRAPPLRYDETRRQLRNTLFLAKKQADTSVPACWRFFIPPK